MQKIKLTQGKFALVDNDMFDCLNQFNWYCNAQGYAVREQSLGNNKSRIIRMHRLINQTPNEMDTDHIDRDRLNNQKVNLRTVTHQQNMFNLTLAKNNKSGIRGIGWHTESKKWRAYIQIKRKSIHLGLFFNLKDAIKVRQQAEQIYHAI